MGPTAYGDSPVGAVAAVGIGYPLPFVLPDHYQELLCDRNAHIHVDLVAIHILCLSLFGAEVEEVWQEVLLSLR
eukprot:7685429-Ditylum_brightwellii.AAC.1